MTGETLRARLEAIRAIADNKNEVSASAFYAISEHLTAMRNILDEAQRIEHFPEGWCEVSDSHPLDTCRIVPDPQPSSRPAEATPLPDASEETP